MDKDVDAIYTAIYERIQDIVNNSKSSAEMFSDRSSIFDALYPGMNVRAAFWLGTPNAMLSVNAMVVNRSHIEFQILDCNGDCLALFHFRRDPK